MTKDLTAEELAEVVRFGIHPEVTAIERARDASDAFRGMGLNRRADAVDALIAEHERLAADLALYQEHAGLTFPRPLKFEPPTDEEYQALAQIIQNAMDEGLGANGWKRQPGGKERRAAQRAVDAGFRRV